MDETNTTTDVPYNVNKTSLLNNTFDLLDKIFNFLDNTTNLLVNTISANTTSLLNITNNDSGDIEGTRSVGRMMLGLLIFFGNLPILFAIKRSKSMHKVTYYLLANLAVADMLFGAAAFMKNSFDNLSMYQCLFSLSLVIVAAGCSVSGILFLCLQSFLSVRYMIAFRTGFTTRVAGMMVASSWVVWIALAMVSIFTATASDQLNIRCSFGESYHSWQYTLAIMLVIQIHLAIVVFFQLGTLYVTRQQFGKLNSKIKSNSGGRAMGRSNDDGGGTSRGDRSDDIGGASGGDRGVGKGGASGSERGDDGGKVGGRGEASRGEKTSTIDVDITVNPSCSSSLSQNSVAVVKAEIQRLNRMSGMVRIVSMVLTVLLFCWGLYTFVMIIFLLCPTCPYVEIVLRVIQPLSGISSLSNVVIYAYKSKEFRQEFKRLLWGCKRQATAGVHPVN